MTPPDLQLRPGGGEVKINEPWYDKTNYENQGYTPRRHNFDNDIGLKRTDTRRVRYGGSRRRARRPSRKYKKSAKRVFRKKSRSTRRR
jgi:hypothetical protein